MINNPEMNWYVFSPKRTPKISTSKKVTRVCVYSDNSDNAFRKLRKSLKGHDRQRYSNPSDYMRLNEQQKSRLIDKIEEEGHLNKAKQNIFIVDSTFALHLQVL